MEPVVLVMKSRLLRIAFVVYYDVIRIFRVLVLRVQDLQQDGVQQAVMVPLTLVFLVVFVVTSGYLAPP